MKQTQDRSVHDGDEEPSEDTSQKTESSDCEVFNICPVCGGRGIPFRAKLICSQCRTILQTCCD